MRALLAEIIGPDILIVLVVIALLFGGAKLPKLARSLGSAKGEFEKGLREGAGGNDVQKSSKAETKSEEASQATEPKAIDSTPTESEPSGQT